MDVFAQIAKDGIKGRAEELMHPTPKPFNEVKVCLEKNNYQPMQYACMDTPEQLHSELEHMRRKYLPFLQHYAVACDGKRQKTVLKNFEWHQVGENANKQNITLPHYGGPLGAAQCVYETDFCCMVQPKQHLFLVITAADYKARIYINEKFVGMHEGFFAAFEFDITAFVRQGSNTLKIELDNDYIMMGSIGEDGVEKLYGDKLYAATGPGYDDPKRGWHHCPPGMGLFDQVYLETRASVFVSDIFTRTLEHEIETWIEITNCDYTLKKINLFASLYGENHVQTVFEQQKIELSTGKAIGLGDTFTEVIARRENTLGKQLPLLCVKGRNLFKFSVSRNDLKTWQPDAPYLYEMQMFVADEAAVVQDTMCRTFGVRTFTQDVQASPKGMFYLNGEKIRLRGANTMGFEQQDVMRGDMDQLVDDMLLAKICNMNFLRLTQRPVQQEVYDVCDHLGLMTQTDLPLFGCLRRSGFCEAVRQAEEMERHVRSHPCNIMVTYINEPFPNANNQPNTNLTRPELEQFFAAADIVVRLNNPDRVIKHVDGDYDPPSTTMPDNHCYPMWYNGHGIDIGKLHKGHWMPVKPNWYYGCGEFGCEGLEDEATMRAGYPASWLPQNQAEDANWSAAKIVNAQTDNFYHFFYEEQHSLKSWIQESQKFQAFATRFMTEAFRRDANMISFAIHLFIDAFPSGWMKTIMDCNRRPKPAFFAYRNALTPILLSLRTDKFSYFGGETISVENWLCNDTPENQTCKIRYELTCNGKAIADAVQQDVKMAANDVRYTGTAVFCLPKDTPRTEYVLRAFLIHANGETQAANELTLQVYPPIEKTTAQAAPILVKTIDEITAQDLQSAENGAVLFVNVLPTGTHKVAGKIVLVKESGMSAMHFAARDTGHSWVENFSPYDFQHWYSAKEDCIVPIAECTFTAEDFVPVLTSRNLDAAGTWQKEMLLGEMAYGKGRIVISQISYQQMQENPAGKILLHKMTNTLTV